MEFQPAKGNGNDVPGVAGVAGVVGVAKPEVDAVRTFVVSVVICLDLMIDSSSPAVDVDSNEDFEGVTRSDDKMEALLGFDPFLFIEIQS